MLKLKKHFLAKYGALDVLKAHKHERRRTDGASSEARSEILAHMACQTKLKIIFCLVS